MNTTLRDVTKYAGYRATKQQTRVKNKDLKASAPGGTPGRAPDGGASRYCDVRGKVMEKAPPSRLILSLHKTIRKQPFPPSIPAISYGWGRGKWVVGVPNPHLGEQPAIGMPKALGGPAPTPLPVHRNAVQNMFWVAIIIHSKYMAQPSEGLPGDNQSQGLTATNLVNVMHRVSLAASNPHNLPEAVIVGHFQGMHLCLCVIPCLTPIQKMWLNKSLIHRHFIRNPELPIRPYLRKVFEHSQSLAPTCLHLLANTIHRVPAAKVPKGATRAPHQPRGNLHRVNLHLIRGLPVPVRYIIWAYGFNNKN